MRRWSLALAGLLLAGGLALATWRVVELEAAELELLGDLRRLDEAGGPALELARAALRGGSLATFEVCALDPLDPDRWAGALELLVRRRGQEEELVGLPLTPAVLGYATRSERAACLLLAYDEPIAESGEYAVLARWLGPPDEALARVPLRAHIMARAPLTWLDGALLVLTLLGALLLLSSLTSWREEAAGLRSGPTAWPLRRAALALAALLAAALLLALLPLPGARGDLARGLALVALQLVLALGLARGARRGELLALERPRRAALALTLAPLLGLGLWLAGDQLGRLVPSTGTAPIESFVSSPPGVITLAALAAAAPLAEELFFRGLLYGLLAERLGQAVAAATTAALFVLAHLEQTWGAWGSVSALALTAIALTALRWWSGSVVAPALAHLAHNGVIIALSLLASFSSD